MTQQAPSKAVLITGCSTGIGRATAAHLAAQGHTVYATARRVEAIADLRERGCRTLALDVTDEASMTAAVEAVVAEAGAVGVLVNNAGYSQSGALESLTREDVRRQFETNVFGLLRMCQLVLPGMRDQGWGRIVNVSSMGANFVFPGGGVYHATKYAVDALSDALRFEVKGFGVDVAIVQPGLIRTEFARAAAATAEPSGDGPYATFDASVARSTRNVHERGPLARLGGGPETVAMAIEQAITSATPKTRYQARDGRWLGLSGSSQSIAERVLRLVGRPELVDEPWFANHAGRLEHQDELDDAIAAWISERDSDEVVRAFEEQEAAIAPVLSIADIVEDPQFLARETITTVAHPVLGDLKMQGIIPRLETTPGRIPGVALGEHNEEVLGPLGYGAEELAELARAGVVAAPATAGRSEG